MKAEDIERLVRESLRRLGRDRSGGSITLTRAHLRSFARACEQHGIGRTKAGARATCCHECGECGGEGYDVEDSGEDCTQCGGQGERTDEVAIDWSALDAEVEKENEDG